MDITQLWIFNDSGFFKNFDFLGCRWIFSWIFYTRMRLSFTLSHKNTLTHKRKVSEKVRDFERKVIFVRKEVKSPLRKKIIKKKCLICHGQMEKDSSMSPDFRKILPVRQSKSDWLIRKL